ncbi:DUF6378 domain-containing protein [Ruegeria atlantica]|uniref:DUF6378 domain-containing protein n=1 Tax=Ruegeria atlantica TaxID=81569 RepID=A0A0P1E2Q5_9RHOB|nr:DUF6378 domain-containing protein [Ruegeria atlantica]CUH42063.1 hypothetical protein RUM4293_00948 [Ruegeria atlantica]
MSDAESIAQVLRDVSAIIRELEGQHGQAISQHRRLAKLWSAYLDTNITETDAAVMLALLKISRIAESVCPPSDSFLDLIGYAAIATTCANETRASASSNNGGEAGADKLSD